MMLLMSPLRSTCSTWGVVASAVTGTSTAAPARRSQMSRAAIRQRMLRVWQGSALHADVKRGTSEPPGANQTTRRIGRMAEPVPASGDEAVLRDLRRRARTTAPLDAVEWRQLIERSADGDRASQERLVAAELGLVIELAESREGRGLSVSDLVQEGLLGLLEAVRSFAPSGEADFSAFAAARVEAQMDAA